VTITGNPSVPVYTDRTVPVDQPHCTGRPTALYRYAVPVWCTSRRLVCRLKVLGGDFGDNIVCIEGEGSEKTLEGEALWKPLRSGALRREDGPRLGPSIVSSAVPAERMPPELSNELNVIANGRHKIHDYVEKCQKRLSEEVGSVSLCGNFRAVEKVISISEIVKREFQSGNANWAIQDTVHLLNLGAEGSCRREAVRIRIDLVRIPAPPLA